MKEQVKKLIKLVTIFTQHDVSCSVGLTDWVAKSDFDRVIEELTKPNVPNRCPICNGSGIVPNGFYSSLNETYTVISTAPEKCVSCNGTGIVWN